MNQYASHVVVSSSSSATPQSLPLLGSSQVQNSAGGYVWSLDDFQRLNRFLILGNEGGTYYASEQELTQKNASCVVRCCKADGARTVQTIVEVSSAGRAPKNDPALFALALAASLGDEKTRGLALAALPRVARTGTHLFTFVNMLETAKLRGWGRGLRKAIGNWYTEKSADQAAYQAVKYRQRGGWSHRDLLRLAHLKVPSGAHNALFRWVVKSEAGEGLPSIVESFIRLQSATSAVDAAALIAADSRLTHEMVPSQFLGKAEVWEALLPNMPLGALVRNLARMTSNGLLAPLSEASQTVVRKLGDGDAIRKARLHPIALLSALKGYEQGHGERSMAHTWVAVPQILDVLDSAFYEAFGSIESTGKHTLLALDISGSMDCGEIAGVPGLTPREASAAMAMVTARVERAYTLVGFTSEAGSGWHNSSLIPLSISPRQRLDDVVKATEGFPHGGTDCSLPMTWALANKVPVDTFVIYTDSETWAGNIHASIILRNYRQATGIPSKLIVVGMTATEFTIADPEDAGMLDVVGFDTATPQFMSDFAKE